MKQFWSNLSPELQKRIKVAIPGVSLFLAVLIFGGKFGTAVIAVVLSLAMIFEFSNMTLSLPDAKEKRTALLGITWLVHLFNFFAPRLEFIFLSAAFVGLFIYYLVTSDRHQNETFQTHLRELMMSLFGLFYLAFLPLYLTMLRDQPSGLHWVASFILMIWAGDVAAYFVGKKYGKRPLFAVISPKKSQEGAWGSLAASILILALYKICFFKDLGWVAILPTAVLVNGAAQLGDLCESFIKRVFQVKDSGSLLPGHGGFLDRFDSVVFSLPIMYACSKVFG